MSDFERRNAAERAYHAEMKQKAEQKTEYDKQPLITKHVMGIAETDMLRRLRKSFSQLCESHMLDPFTALAVAGQMFGEYAALMDHMLKTEPEKFKGFYKEDIHDRLKGQDMLRTFETNLKDGYENFKPKKSQGLTFSEQERERIKSMGLGELLDLLDKIERKE